MQGGDLSRRHGGEQQSIYGSTFEDETFALQHTGRGTLSMANAGPNTNASQWFVTFQALPHLDGKHVVFGRLVSGDKVLHELEEAANKYRGKPDAIVIRDSGQLA